MKARIHIISNVVIITVLSVLAYFSFFHQKQTNEVIKPYYKCETQEKIVCMMFNVYENTQIVEDILRVLDKKNAKATFFLGGIWVEKNIDLTRKLSVRGMEIATHGYLHRDHSKLNYERNREEIAISKSLIEQAINKSIYLFAPPSGAFNQYTLDVCDELGLTTVMWSKDTIDWRDQNIKVIYERATKNLKNGDFVLMHPTKCTLEALPDIIDFYHKGGYQTKTITDAVCG